MKTFETPYENLDNKSKETIELCKEIILWSTKARSFFRERSDLREKVTNLYDRLGKTDMINDDKYYKIYEEADQLRNNYEKLKEKVDNEDEKNKEIPIDFINEVPEKIINKIKKRLKEFKFFNGEQEWIKVLKWNEVLKGKRSESTYGDFINIKVTETEDSKYKIDLDEIFNYYIHKWNPHIHEFIKKFEKEFPKIKKDINTFCHHRMHDYDAAYEFTSSLENINSDNLEDILKFIIDTIKSSPRERKKPKSENK
ncbi:hypothetical protein K8R66_00330 [bacterium]|nr:hypothetical protein [bacterium]